MPKFRDFTNLDLNAISNELRFLQGSRVRKVYQYGDNEFKIKFSVPEKGSMDVVILLPYTIHITKQAKESPGEPPTFAMTLRKYLENKKVERAQQFDLDRIFIFEFSEFKLIAEFFGKGNFILLDSANKILAVSRPEETKARKVRKGETYSFPEKKRKDPDEISESIYDEAMAEKEKDRLHLISFLSKKLSVPPFYWEEILFRSGLEPLLPLAKCDKGSFISIVKHTIEFSNEIKNPKPSLYSDGTYSILPLSKKSGTGAQIETFNSFSELMDKIYSSESQQVVSNEVSEKQEKIKRKLQQQKKHFEELLLGVEENKKAGNMILEKEVQLNSIIDEYKQMKKEGKPVAEIESRLSKMLGKEVKLDKGKITFETES